MLFWKWIVVFIIGEAFLFVPLLGGEEVPPIEPPVSGRSATLEDTKPADVRARVTWIEQELELLRFVMGKPSKTPPPFTVSNASPHEVFFQALSLFRKADHLAFEFTRVRKKEPEIPQGQTRPYHVFLVVHGALQRIWEVKDKLNIPEIKQEQRQPDESTPTDVFHAIVQANRQLNILLTGTGSPSQVFQQVTLAMSYSSRLLATFPEAQRVPSPPPFERGKRPHEVYQTLVSCFKLIKQITETSNLQILQLNIKSDKLEYITPNDVYDLASLIVSELSYLHQKTPQAQMPRDSYYPGRKFPSHVYQRAQMLKIQLLELQKFVNIHPNWLQS